MIASYRRPESIPNRAGYRLRVLLGSGQWRDDEVTMGPDWCHRLRWSRYEDVVGWLPREAKR